MGFAKEDFEKLLTKQVEMIDAKIIPSMEVIAQVKAWRMTHLSKERRL